MVPVETPKADEKDAYLLLLALNSDAGVPWDELELKVCADVKSRSLFLMTSLALLGEGVGRPPPAARGTTNESPAPSTCPTDEHTTQ